MDKREILKRFEKIIADDLAMLTQSAKAAHEAAIHSESKAEDQYDTRGLEASYLAGAQSRRAMETEEALALFRHVDLLTFHNDMKISTTALVCLNSDEKTLYYFLMPLRGGMQISFEGKTIQTVTPQSPIGQALIGRKVGDEFEVVIKGITKDYQITAVY